ncbi:MAG: iron ABC transporter permease [Candidatus Omnitrophota bacterium]
MKNKFVKWIMWIGVLVLIVLGVSVFSLCSGSAGIPVKKVVGLIFEAGESPGKSILFDIRLPRVILGFAIGGALSLAGVVLQGMFRNVLVEPYTLGISGGAALGVCANIVLGLRHTLGAVTLPFFGFLGAGIVVLLVYSLSVKNNRLNIQSLLLTGVMISFVSSSLIMLLMASSRVEDLHGIVFWIMGSLEEPNWVLIKVAMGVSLLALVISYIFCFDLNAFSLGEEEALHLGVNTERTKRLLFLLASILTGLSVSVAGVIGFVGLIVPHFARMFIGSDYRILLISSFLCGAGFLIFCDTIARTIIAPMELPVGVITGIIGGVLFVYALNKKKIYYGVKQC